MSGGFQHFVSGTFQHFNIPLSCGAVQHSGLSLPSLRIDAFSLDVMSKIQDIRKSSITFAPEAPACRRTFSGARGLKGSIDAMVPSGW